MKKIAMVVSLAVVFALLIISTLPNGDYDKAIIYMGGEKTVHDISGYYKGINTYELIMANGDKLLISKENCTLVEARE